MTNENIISENTQRKEGRDAQRNNILAAKLVAQTIKSTLGPKGMDKMLVDSLGDIIVTNDGVTILREMQIEHPTAKMIVEIAKTQESEVGDGTTTAVIFAGEFLKNAEELLYKKIHPTILVKGFNLAQKKSNQILNEMSFDISINDTDKLINICQTAMTGKGAEFSKEHLSKILVNCVKNIVENDECDIDINAIKFQKKVGGSIEDTQLIDGILLDKNKLLHSMPNKVNEAKILIMSCPLEHKDIEFDAKIQITDPSQIQSFLNQEETIIKNKVDKIISSGANVVFVQKGIDDYAQHLLSENNIFAVRRITKDDIEKLSLATGAKIVNNIDAINNSSLGYANIVEQKKISDHEMIFVSGCKNPKSSTILIRGGTEHVLSEIERALDDSLRDIIVSLKYKKVVCGAGSVEIKLADELKKYANTLSGREQLAVLSYANAIEIIPSILSENAGLDPIDIIADMKSKLYSGLTWPGVNVENGSIIDAKEHGILEPLKVKLQALKSATEVAIMILRTDDVIAANRLKGNESDLSNNF
ncbi:thermosome subunit [Candidatus Woesearchaeota archaeon]|jgi:archaeal chaperonin|nr:thermosome subunit [Candidatus Woesearchaeota archaeon]MBT4387810.1 thermosome subunit [Candidatus Woesearchaeota archaeon]MBT4595629.1 thermosome subunit [Candidatus Woesearchaeota archaeon]MBT6505185.1 thermosome subunit [Candidatus Woesearchaeota archaeon]MBT7296075.1 thermosome subunit [Candidatus Woesearchaeota archaeon]